MKASRQDRVVLWFVLVGAIVYSLVTLVFGVGHSVQVMFAAETPVAMLTSAPVPTNLNGDATIASGSFTDAALTVGGLSDFARVMLSAGNLLGVLTSLAVSLAVAYFCWSLVRARPFRRSLTIATLTAGMAMVFGGILSQAVTGFGTMQTALDIDPTQAVFDVGFWFDPALLFGGFAILALGIAFQLGERLQRDTEGLI
jgi:hypothetical protein